MNNILPTVALAMKSFLLILFFSINIGCKGDKEEYSQTQDSDLLQKQEFLFDSLNSNWILEEQEGNLVKTEIITLDDRKISNQVLRLDMEGQIDTFNSRFFDLQIEDTIYIGRNIGVLNSNTYNKEYDEVYSYVIIKNQYSESETRLDTFGNNERRVQFGIFANEEGNKIIKGELFEQYLLPQETIAKDSVTMNLIEIHSYFEKKVFVKDSLNNN